VFIEHLNINSSDKELIAQGPDDLWLNIQIIKITDDSKNYKGHLVVLRNVTIRKKLEIQTSDLNDVLFNSHKQLLELNAQKDKILSIIGHDLKTPFHQITSLSQILKEDINSFDRETIKDLIDDILKASESGYKILEEILEWAKTQRDSTSINPRQINIHELIDEILDSLSITAANKRIEFIKVIPEDTCIYADKNMSTIVFRNILSNAIKFSFPEGKISITSHSVSGKTSISIQDFGVGIPPNELSSLLSNSFKSSRQGTLGEKGTGLGLLLSRELIFKNNGTIEVESEPGKGTTFKITLPFE
jgi:signal transduction histidine kinase